MPNLVQSVEGVPAFVHGGPFANIAHGCNSVIATKMAMAHADWVVTEAGFAFDLGGEKFFDIKCRTAGLSPSAVVIVATVRALKRHGDVPNDALATPDPAAVERGVGNLLKHVESAQAFGKPVVVALNRFATDSDEEIEIVRRACAGIGVTCIRSDHYSDGGAGAVELAKAVVEQAEATPSPLKPLYELSDPIPVKMEKIARTMYGAGKVVFTAEAEKDLKLIRKLGGEGLPICVAKTPTSLTDNPSIVGRPEGFEITVRKLILSAGAGFVVALLGDILRMPGLPASPQALRIDITDGQVHGLMAG
ncbi:MAG TPA: formate--tetrahydrofolate ligase [Thermoanaerobaculia bacterium]|nr:formate--tetrahydrofolate ligase [Thermoanaerobaculia bacterium]